MGGAGAGCSRVSGVVLDAGALIALERRDRRIVRLLELAVASGQAIDVPTGVVAQVWRGGERQALLARFLASDGITFADLDLVTARAVGELVAGAGGSDIVDAHVALVALRSGRAVITSDPDDIARFGGGVRIIPV